MSAVPKLDIEHGEFRDDEGNVTATYTLHARRAAVKPFRPLTEQQKRVCRLVARGASYKTIAGELRIARRTAKCHVHRIADLLPTDDLPAKQRVQIWAILAGYSDAA